ncbi:PorP/SprF family type IX secretion system membrane protein [Mucilaginibacter sp. BT774]|uniref:PorP/SprF family type IX secretion system membrane protein n=1 Tax=Mucilaginibacter sp. BT774 TaxID=3062276 RepID=UPI002676E604|nr:PorP/SprF family type IX secretion system membrane protein [Mucilaginibacter sp. BT774]MDO3627645.1 PorP/SprF family type IX secretion system membrane protein [Mucilaginibacter sp. BT774]
MKRFKQWMLCFILIGFATVLSAQQQFGYTQYMDNLTPFNQAYSLLDKTGSVSALVRNQFVGIQGAPRTFILNGNVPVESLGGSAGILVMSDQFAVEHNTQFSAFLSKGIQLTDSEYLGVSMSVGLKNYVANFSSLDASDPQFRDDVRQTRPNIGFGVLYYSDNYYIGVSMPELTITGLGTASLQSNVNDRNHYYFSGAFITELAEGIKLKPAAMVAYTRGVPVTANLSSVIFLKDMLGVGINYRTDNEAAGILSVNMNSFKLGYSYQFNTASVNLGGLNSSIHEITLTYRFGNNTQPKLL